MHAVRSTLAFVALSVSAFAVSPALAADPLPPASLDEARLVRDAGLRDDVAYDLLRSLTTDVGPRPAGSPNDARAVAWGLAHLKALGFVNVHAETCTVPHWVRGDASVSIVSPSQQPLAACALGGSVGTPDGGVEGDVVAVPTIEAMQALGAERVRGRIVFFFGRMERVRDGGGYSRAVVVRGRGAAEAAKLGAVGVVIRSIGTDNNRLPHTGSLRYDSTGVRIPGFAISNPDADLLERALEPGTPVRLRLWSTAHQEAPQMSANVIGEMPGRDPKAGVVIVGGHLDCWDLGTGAHDDGAGVAIMTAAAKIAGSHRVRPRRTIRVVMFANEEHGLSGARAYGVAHAAEVPQIALAMESDLGAFEPWGMESHVPEDKLPLVHAMQGVLEPLGIVYQSNASSGDADTGVLHARGVPVIEVLTDARPYFELHHTANDTFDKVDPAMVRRNVAAYAALAWMAAEADGGFGRVPVQETTRR